MVVLAAAMACSRERQYELSGQVVRVDRARAEITIQHGDIVGFMPGMTMPFKVRNPEILEGSTPGDLVSATLVVNGTDAHLSALRRTGHRPLTGGATVSPVLLEPGTPVADSAFIDQTGTNRSLADWRGRALAVTFVYTRCPMPDFCPRMNRQFSGLQHGVLADPRLRDRVRLLSVTLDPGHDTAQILAPYARQAGANPQVWSFLTGEPEPIERFAAQFGVSIVRDPAGGPEIGHTLRTAIIGADGRLIRILSGGDWSAGDVLPLLRTGL
jgi:protein SCO1/2